MLETPPYPRLLADASDNAWGDADNQQGSRPTDAVGLTPQRLHAELLTATIPVTLAYLFGSLHDATLSSRHRTVRFGQSEVLWLQGLQLLFEKLGQRSWIYREGRERRLWILETSSRWIRTSPAFAGVDEHLAYARGYFDTEGSVPHDPATRFYIQFVQKNWVDIGALRQMLEQIDIRCGKLHNPSVRVDSEMWRFYVLAESHRAFAERVSSWHPLKRRRLDRWLTGRMKI
ncbi:MAG: LAGLIDADG family homing endonuclease [Candidatus Dormibacteria bacterium]